MKFLHTSDWHLGKVFHEKVLIEDQKFVLDQILEILASAQKKDTPYAALVISGDIYDRAIPSAEATNLFNYFLVKAATIQPDLHIFVNCGNHDNAVRLSFCAEILEKHNIHITTDTKKITEPVIVTQADEKIAFYQLPFLTPFSITPKNDDLQTEISEEQNPCKTQQQLYEAACTQIIKSHKENFGNMPSVLNAHLYTIGSLVGKSERANIGTAEQVNVSVFKDFTYGAFGHIHKYQVCDKENRCYYPGSLLPYNFDDAPQTGMLEVEIKNSQEKPNVNRILFKPLHKIAKITAKMENLIGSNADNALIKENADNYVQIILTDEVMPTEAYANLKTVFPNLLLLSQHQTNSHQNIMIEQRREAMQTKNPETIFNQFIKDIYGEQPDAEKAILFEEQKKIFIEQSANLFK